MTKMYLSCRLKIVIPALLASLLAGCGSASDHPTPPKAASEFLYATNFEGITSFPINGSIGALGSGTPAVSGFTSIGFLANMVSDPAGKLLFVGGLGNSSAEVFSINATTGGLTVVPGSPFSLQSNGAGNLAIHPSGKFLYAATGAGIAAFMVNSTTGVLSPIVGSPFSDGSSLNASVVDPSGKFLYSSGNTTQSTVSVFAIDQVSGALKPIAGSPFQSPINSPGYSIAVHPSGTFLYMSFPVVNEIAAWNVNRATGGLAVVPGSPFATGSGQADFLLAPSGNFLYALNSNDATISGFSIDASNGALIPISGSPFPVSSGTGYVTIDPGGQFLYAANASITANTISGFNINASTGDLTPLSGSPFTAKDPTLMTIVKVP